MEDEDHCFNIIFTCTFKKTSLSATTTLSCTFTHSTLYPPGTDPYQEMEVFPPSFQIFFIRPAIESFIS